MSKSKIIYGNSPFIEDMGLLTTLCLLHDEILLFGTGSLGDQFEKYWSQNGADTESAKVIEQTFQTLEPEGVVTFLSPNVAMGKYPHSNVELDGIEGVEVINDREKKALSLKINEAKLSPLSKLILRGASPEQRTVSSLIRDMSLFSTAYTSQLPVILTGVRISNNHSSNNVEVAANYLAHKALEKLALPQLKAYHAEDILEARIKLKTELTEFKAAILDLIWLLHQKIDLDENIESLPKECNILIDTKVTSALMLLECAISTHNNKSIRRILQSSGNVILELGKSLVSPDVSASILGSSSAILKATESIGSTQPSNHIASFIYRVREKSY